MGQCIFLLDKESYVSEVLVLPLAQSLLFCGSAARNASVVLALH